VDCGALPLLAGLLRDPMPSVRETAACALGHVAKQSAGMARRVVATGAVPALVSCLQVGAAASDLCLHKEAREACITPHRKQRSSSGAPLWLLCHCTHCLYAGPLQRCVHCA